jgi:uncharacterized protein (TIGR02246 family)
MTAATADAVHPLWAERLNAGDLDGLLALYEDDAAFVAGPQTVVNGRAAISEALQGFIALKPSVTLNTLLVVNGSGLALVIAKWELQGTGPDGSPVTLSGQTSDTLRRQADGTWKFAIDNPFGDAAAGG